MLQRAISADIQDHRDKQRGSYLSTLNIRTTEDTTYVSLENSKETESRMKSRTPYLKELHGTYVKTPTKKADVIALHYASTFTPNTHSHVP
jgi:hypothetical protein